MTTARAHVFVAGRVQGVFFRESMRRRARELGVCGYVRNLPDGRVEVVLEGEEGAVQGAVRYAREGPGLSRVIDVDVREEPYRGEFDAFEVLS